MDYGSLLRRTWDIIWKHKFLILLGVLVVVGSGGSNGASGRANVDFSREGDMPPMEQWPESWPDEFPNFGEGGVAIPALGVVAIVLLVGLAIFVGLALWALATLARGGLIAGANAIDAGLPTDFRQAFSLAWRKGWALLGIGVLPGIPALLLVLAGLGAAGVYAFFSESMGRMTGPNIGVLGLFGALTCVTLPLVFALNLLRTFADRACMIEDLGVFAAYRRGFEVLMQNFGPALLLFVIQFLLGLGIGLLLVFPGVLLIMCCLLWPVFLLIQGTLTAYFSTLWTLAWREWTVPGTPLEAR